MIGKYKEFYPEIAEGAYVVENATVLGRVKIEEGASVWYGAVVRGDNGPITVGKNTNIQDNSTLHCAPEKPLAVGDGVTVGHNVVLHSCTIGDNCLIGMGAVIMNDAVIGKNSIVGAGALVTEGKVFPPGSLIVGAPARVKRAVTEAETEAIAADAEEYLRLATEYGE